MPFVKSAFCLINVVIFSDNGTMGHLPLRSLMRCPLILLKSNGFFPSMAILSTIQVKRFEEQPDMNISVLYDASCIAIFRYDGLSP